MEPDRFRYDLENCGIKRALDVLGEKWTLLVLREAFYGVRRFDDFLTQAGILKRVDYREADQRARAEYHLDEKGIDLFSTIYALSQWGERWMPSPAGPVARVTERATGRPLKVVLTADSKQGEIAIDARGPDCAWPRRQADQMTAYGLSS
jgi:DNA-binding HxlR family transcriptional regulator